MGKVVYLAKRTFAPGHAVDVRYAISVGITQATPSTEDVKQTARSPGGATETSYERSDVTWSFETEPVSGYDLLLVREFMDSTESGETFAIYLRDSDAEPLYVKRFEDQHSETASLACGAEDRDSFRASFTALQVAAEEVSETTDVYAPSGGGDEDTGGLDPPPPSGIPTITAGGAEGEQVGYSQPTGSAIGSIVDPEVGAYSIAEVLDIFEEGGYVFDGFYLTLDSGIEDGAPDDDYFTSVTINGHTYLTADVDLTDTTSASGGLDNTARVWVWEGPADLELGNSYELTFVL